MFKLFSRKQNMKVGNDNKGITQVGRDYINNSITNTNIDNSTTNSIATNLQIFHVQVNATTRQVLEPGIWNKIEFTKIKLNIANSYNSERNIGYIGLGGLYEFHLYIDLKYIDLTASKYSFRLVTSNGDYQRDFASDTLQNKLPITINEIADMDTGDTAYYEIMQTGGKKSTTIMAESYFKSSRAYT